MIILILQLLFQVIWFLNFYFKSFWTLNFYFKAFWPNFNKKQCVIVFSISKMSFKHKCHMSIYMTVKLLSVNCHCDSQLSHGNQINQHNKNCFELIMWQLTDSSLTVTWIDTWYLCLHDSSNVTKIISQTFFRQNSNKWPEVKVKELKWPEIKIEMSKWSKMKVK